MAIMPSVRLCFFTLSACGLTSQFLEVGSGRVLEDS